MPRASVRLGAAVCAAMVVAAGAAAQSLPEARRTPALLGGTGDGHREADVVVSSWAATDDELAASQMDGEVAGLSSRRSRGYQSIGLRFGYLERFHRSTLAVTGRAAAQRFGGLTSDVAVQRAAGAGWDVHGRRSRLLLQQDVAAFPLYGLSSGVTLFAPALGEAPTEVADEALAAMRAIRSSSAADFRYTAGRRLTFETSGRFTSTRLDGSQAQLRQASGAAHLTLSMGRDVSLVTGYGVQQGRYRLLGVAAPPADIQNIDLGLDYHRALSVSRRTTVGFSSGPVVVRDRLGRTMRTVLGGQARLNHQIGRTWQATAAFVRSVAFLDAFVSPMVTDGLRVNVGGLVRRRVELMLAADGLHGRAATATIGSGAESRTDSATGTARMAVGLSRATALTVEYRYQYSRMDGTALAGTLPRGLDRQSVRVGVDVRVPLLR